MYNCQLNFTQYRWFEYDRTLRINKTNQRNTWTRKVSFKTLLPCKFKSKMFIFILKNQYFLSNDRLEYFGIKSTLNKRNFENWNYFIFLLSDRNVSTSKVYIHNPSMAISEKFYHFYVSKSRLNTIGMFEIILNSELGNQSYYYLFGFFGLYSLYGGGESHQMK